MKGEGKGRQKEHKWQREKLSIGEKKRERKKRQGG